MMSARRSILNLYTGTDKRINNNKNTPFPQPNIKHIFRTCAVIKNAISKTMFQPFFWEKFKKEKSKIYSKKKPTNVSKS